MAKGAGAQEGGGAQDAGAEGCQDTGDARRCSYHGRGGLAKVATLTVEAGEGAALAVASGEGATLAVEAGEGAALAV